MRTLCSLLLAALSVTPLEAQSPQPKPDRFSADRYFPEDYRNLVFVDLEMMRETGLWDEIEVGLLKLVLTQLEREAGFRLSDLNRLTMIAEMPGPAADGMASSRPQDAVVLEGRVELAVPDRITGRDDYVREEVGGQEVLRRERWGGELFFRPRPEIQVIGSPAILEPALEGKRRKGRPCADILSLLAERRKSLLYFVVDVADPRMNERVVRALFPESEWPEGDGLQFLMVRCSATGDPEDPNVELELVLRHAKAGDGLAVTQKGVAGALAKFGKDPQFRLIAPLLKKVQTQTDRGDLVLRLDLGRGRAAAGNLAMMALPLLSGGAPQAARAAKAKVVAEELQVAEPPPPPPPEPKRPAGKGKGK